MNNRRIIQELRYEMDKFGVKEVLFHILYFFCSEKYLLHMLIERDKYYSGLSGKWLKKEIEDIYWVKTGKKMDFSSPKGFNEKIQWLKLYDNTPNKTKLADKYEVREWIKSKIGEEYLIPLIGVYCDFSEIGFESLPNRFVLKANHGSAMNEIVLDKNKLTRHELKAIRNKTKNWMNTPVYAYYLEMQYKDIPRRIVIEQYIEEKDGNLHDYKIHCFNGKPRIIQVVGDRNSKNHRAKAAFFDTDWKRRDILYNNELYEENIPKPECLDKMLEIAQILSNDFIYVRVDLYCVGEGQIYFGEMTFTPHAGFANFGNEETERIVGDMMIIPL